MQQEIHNPVLAAAEQKVESQVLPANRQNYMKIVVAGMHVGLDKGPDGILASLRNSQDPVRDAARGAVALVMILRHQTQASGRGVMPAKAMVPAAMTLMLRALDFVDQLGLVKIDNDQLVRATHVFTNAMLAAFRITPPMLQHATEQVHSLMQNPQAMQAIQRQAGAPGAPAPAGGAPPAAPWVQ